MELGCSTILYGDHSLEVALERIKATGYKAIELCGIPGMAPHLNPGEDAGHYESIKSLVAFHDLGLESIGASGNLGDRDRFLQIMDAAAAVGAPLITTGGVGQSHNEVSYKSVVENINGLAKEAESRGVKLSIKPHVSNAVYNTETAHRFMQEIDRDWVGLNYDTTHIWRTPQQEVPEETIHQIREYILSLRIRDVKGRQTAIGPVENQVAGNGDMDLIAQAAAFKQIPDLDYAVLEIVGTKEMTVDEIDSVIGRSYDYFKTLYP